jgi:hypothetical protein
MTSVYKFIFKQCFTIDRSFNFVEKLTRDTQTQIDQWVSLARQGRLKGNYGIQETNFLRDGLKHAPEIKQGRVLVIGSQTPWVNIIHAAIDIRYT